jgi:hypothetical protein
VDADAGRGFVRGSAAVVARTSILPIVTWMVEGETGAACRSRGSPSRLENAPSGACVGLNVGVSAERELVAWTGG